MSPFVKLVPTMIPSPVHNPPRRQQKQQTHHRKRIEDVAAMGHVHICTSASVPLVVIGCPHSGHCVLPAARVLDCTMDTYTPGGVARQMSTGECPTKELSP